MAKKKSAKKHNFKYAQPSGVAAVAGVGASPVVAATVEMETTGRYGYVTSDLRRLSVLAGALIAVEVVLWYLTQAGFIKF